MEKKPETPIRKARRKYEEVNKELRDQATKQFNTRLPRETYDEICAFLKRHKITKVELITIGYSTLIEHYEKNKQENK